MRKKSKMGTKMSAMGPGMAKGKKVPSGAQNDKLEMVAKDGKMVPFYAADGKGKMNNGGVIKTMKKMYRGGMTSKTKPKGGKRGGRG